MPGSVKRRGKRWQARFSHTVAGHRHQEAATFDTKTAAQDWLAEERRKSRHGHSIQASKDDLDTWFAEWMATRPDLSEASQRAYRQNYLDHAQPVLGHVPISQISPSQIQKIYNRLRGSTAPRMVQAVLSQVFNLAVRQRRLEHNPCASVTVPKARSSDDEKTVRVWTIDQLNTLLDCARETESWYYPMFATMAATGMRPGEAMGLHWEDVNLAKRAISITRTTSIGLSERRIVERPKRSASRRTLAVDVETVQLLGSHWRELERIKALRPEFTGLVFPNMSGGIMHSGQIAPVLRRLAKRAEVPVLSPHAFRHTHASLLLAAGRPIHYVQRRLGHSSVTTTLKYYAHLLPNTDFEDADTYAALREDARIRATDAAREHSGNIVIPAPPS